MQTFDRIIMPTNGSESAEAALDYAGSLAQKYDAELHIMYVADIRAQVGEPTIEFVMENLQEIGQDAVEDIESRISDDIETVTSVETGIPHKEIKKYSQKEDIQAVTMSTHGRSGLERVLLGSVTEKVVRTSEIPVMTVPAE
ncbi:MAG: universal stress protein [Candidatus Nanohaloarchaea archaeon]